MTLSLPAESAFAMDLESRPSAGLGRGVGSGRLSLDFAADANARTYLRRQYANYPFHVCRVQFQDRDLPGLATLYIQSCSGGIYEDDRLELTIAVREQAQAHVSTQSATIVHSMPRGNAEQRLQIQCERGSYLEYLPDPQILFSGSRYRSSTSIQLGEGAIAVVSDSFLRHDPEGKDGMFSAYSSEIIIEKAGGKALAIDRLKIDKGFQPSCPGILGSFGAQGTLVIAGLLPLPRAIRDNLQKIKFDQAEAAMGFTHLPKSAGILVRVLAADGAALKRVTHMVWCATRLALKGSRPVERRK
jgi:urease accessory protein